MPARRTSNALKVIQSTARSDRKPRRDFAARLARTPSPPAYLSQRATEAWRRLAPAATNLGVLTLADLAAFELLCVTLGAEAEARAVLERDGLTTSTGSGGRKPHPAVRIAETARAQAARLLEAFGLTPRGRQSLDTPPPAPDPASAKFFRS